MVSFLRGLDWDVFGMDTAAGHEQDARGLFVHPSYPLAPDFDLLVHCAYHVGGRQAIDNDKAALAYNLSLDSTMFDYAVQSGRVGHVLYFSSSAVYPVHLQNFGSTIRLEEGQAPPSPYLSDADYGYAKCVGEQLAINAVRNGLKVTVVRPFSGYGADQSLDYPFPSLLRQAMKPAPEVWGNKGQVRDWIHIDDAVRASYEATFNFVDAEPVNICTGVGTTMEEIIHMARQAAGIASGPYEITERRDKPMGVMHRVGSPTIMHQFYPPSAFRVPNILAGIELALSER
jgi:nucleoside-diphosphate-sugar epimerase